MRAKELAEILLTKPESDVCIKREYVFSIYIDVILAWLNDIQKELED